jgi:VWFA-related protein
MRLVLFAVAMCLGAQDTVIRTTVPLVLVPTSVTDRHGKTVDGLIESDFEVFDNAKPVKHSLETTIQPVALVVAVQTSGIAGPALAKIQRIGAMFEPLVVGDGGVAAIITYSDEVKVRQEFTHSADEFTQSMRRIEPDGAGSRMNDAVLEAVDMLASRPKFRRVLVVIGESRDRGSQARLDEAVTHAQSANVTIYPVNYSVYKTSFTSRGEERFKGSGRLVYANGGGMDLLAVITEIGRMGTRNAGEALAKYTGGGKVSFTRLAGLERVIGKVGEDLHSQYLLSFQAESTESKIYHRITVNVKRAQTVVRARPGYWPE